MGDVKLLYADSSKLGVLTENCFYNKYKYFVFVLNLCENVGIISRKILKMFLVLNIYSDTHNKLVYNKLIYNISNNNIFKNKYNNLNTFSRPDILDDYKKAPISEKNEYDLFLMVSFINEYNKSKKQNNFLELVFISDLFDIKDLYSTVSAHYQTSLNYIKERSKTMVVNADSISYIYCLFSFKNPYGKIIEKKYYIILEGKTTEHNLLFQAIELIYIIYFNQFTYFLEDFENINFKGIMFMDNYYDGYTLVSL